MMPPPGGGHTTTTTTPIVRILPLRAPRRCPIRHHQLPPRWPPVPDMLQVSHLRQIFTIPIASTPKRAPHPLEERILLGSRSAIAFQRRRSPSGARAVLVHALGFACALGFASMSACCALRAAARRRAAWHALGFAYLAAACWLAAGCSLFHRRLICRGIPSQERHGRP
jgi:hypothetical protein